MKRTRSVLSKTSQSSLSLRALGREPRLSEDTAELLCIFGRKRIHNARNIRLPHSDKHNASDCDSCCNVQRCNGAMATRHGGVAAALKQRHKGCRTEYLGCCILPKIGSEKLPKQSTLHFGAHYSVFGCCYRLSHFLIQRALSHTAENIRNHTVSPKRRVDCFGNFTGHSGPCSAKPTVCYVSTPFCF